MVPSMSPESSRSSRFFCNKVTEFTQLIEIGIDAFKTLVTEKDRRSILQVGFFMNLQVAMPFDVKKQNIKIARFQTLP